MTIFCLVFNKGTYISTVLISFITSQVELNVDVYSFIEFKSFSTFFVLSLNITFPV